jgi:hypothetical protein
VAGSTLGNWIGRLSLSRGFRPASGQAGQAAGWRGLSAVPTRVDPRNTPRRRAVRVEAGKGLTILGAVMKREGNNRKRRIDPKLTAAGWTVAPDRHSLSHVPPPASAVEEWPMAADAAYYTLTDDGGVHAVVEAQEGHCRLAGSKRSRSRGGLRGELQEAE